MPALARWCCKLLDVLHLLTQTFDLGFEVDDEVRDLGVLALGATGVGFAQKLLTEKVELAAGGTALGQQLAGVVDVHAQPIGFFGGVDLLGEEGDLLRESLGVDVDVELLHAGLQFVVQRLRRLLAEGFDALRKGGDDVDVGEQHLVECSALSGARGAKHVEGVVDGAEHGGGELTLVVLFFLQVPQV